jgi:transposase-like protein
MPWKGVTVSEERHRFLEDFRLGYYTVTDLAERFSISRKTAHKWIDRLEKTGEIGFHELSRRPHHSPAATAPATVCELVPTPQAHPHWGPDKLLDLMHRRHPRLVLPGVSSIARILDQGGAGSPTTPLPPADEGEEPQVQPGEPGQVLGIGSIGLAGVVVDQAQLAGGGYQDLVARRVSSALT